MRGRHDAKRGFNPMRKNIPQSSVSRVLAISRFRGKDMPAPANSLTSLRKQFLEHGVLTLDRWRSNFEDSLDEVLSSALVAQDKELASILHELEQLSKTLKSDASKSRILSTTLERTVLCTLKQSLLDRELRSLALTDDLTCLYNRRAFLALAGQQLRVNRRNAQGLLLFFADINHLKDINDTYGHREGDLAIVRTADALEKTFRNSDVIARLGGDEFAVLALEASNENRAVILRRLEKNLKLSNAEESRYELSLSVGMTRFDPHHPVSLGKLIAQADEAMYEEKKNRTALCVK
jgi:diguanylate cyclase (GGDEF)-like protein